MKLSVKEAAALLGRSPRTIRYMAADGRIPAKREGHRWVFDKAQLEAVGADGGARAEAVAQVEAVIDAGLDAARPPTPGRRGFYSVRDVRTFQDGAAALKALAPLIDAEPGLVELDSSVEHLRSFLRRLTDGIHQFHPHLKLPALVEARRAACAAIADLAYLRSYRPDLPLDPIIDRIEHDTLRTLRGLIRRAEKRAK